MTTLRQSINDPADLRRVPRSQLGRLGRGEAVEGAAIESCRRWGRSRGRRGTEEGKQRAADEAGQRACRH